MTYTLDANILFAAILRDGAIRRVILSRADLLMPEYALIELENHLPELLARSDLEEEELRRLLAVLLQRVTVVPKASLDHYKVESIAIIGHIDINDAPYIACTLATGSILWSDDARLKAQNVVAVKSTKEMLEFHP